jgi:eukaryotic-like serine/threonine-protein kinase
MDPHYIAATGHLLFARRGTLMAVGFDPDSLAIEGSPFVVVDDVMHAVGMPNGLLETGAAQVAVSASGNLAYVTGGTFPPRDRVIDRVSADGQEEQVLPDSGAYAMPRMSPDGNRLAFTLQDGRGSSIQVRDLARGVTRRLNTGSFAASWPLWSADGTSILYASSLEDGVFNIYRIAADGSGEPVRLAPSPDLQIPTDWSSQGVIAYAACSGSGLCNIWTLPPNGEPSAFAASDANEMHASFSHDGQWLAYSSDETGRTEVYVRPYPGPGPATQISSNGGTSPAWSADDSRIYYLAPGGSMMDVDVTPADSFVAGRPEVLLESWSYGNYFPGRGYDVLPNGSFIVAAPVSAIAARDDPEAVRQNQLEELPGDEIHVVLNFTEELRRRAGE